MIERQKVLYERIEVIRLRRIRDDINDPGSCEICLLATRLHEIAAGTSRFVIDDPVSPRGLDLTQIGARKVIPLLRKVVISRIDLGGQNCLRHECALPRM